METGTIILIAVIAIPLLFVIITYNRLVSMRNTARNAFANIDTMLKKRYDLIPNLVASVQQYMKHEQGTLEKVTAMRARAMSGGLSDDEKVQLDNDIRTSMRSIMVAVENYPDLKANENFLQLQRAMNEIEEQLSASRRSYNMAVTDYNTSLEVFPSNLIAGMFSFKRKDLFVIAEQERQNVDVKSLFNS